MNDVIELITHTTTKDALNQQILTPSYRQVFAEEKPIHSAEFFAAGQRGIKPRAVYEIYTMEYLGEEQLRYGGESGATYHIYRTYKNTKTGKTELYCEVRVGA